MSSPTKTSERKDGGLHASMELTWSVPPSPPLLSEERHRAQDDITSSIRERATTTVTTAVVATTGSKRTCSPVRSAVARHRQVAPVNTQFSFEENSNFLLEND